MADESRVPSAQELEQSGINTFDGEEGDTPTQNTSRALGEALEKAKVKEKEKEGTIQQWHSMGSGLAALPKKLVERIRANEYIDFTELPPAKGKARSLLCRQRTWSSHGK